MNIIQFFGFYNVSSTNERFIVTEFLNKGNLADLLRSEEGEKLSYIQLLSMYVAL